LRLGLWSKVCLTEGLIEYSREALLRTQNSPKVANIGHCNGTPNDAAEPDDFEGEDAPDGVEGARDVIKGFTGRDAASGNSGNDRILGGEGRDGNFAVNGVLDGDDGNDYVDGGPDADVWIFGDVGRDTVLGGAGADESVEGNDGNDNVCTAAKRGGRPVA
jgi:Ca2+-binding RTX toxin-like protein